MNKLVIAIAALLCACGTKQNPRACCTDAADCMNVGLPVGTVCDEGLLCRGNRCVEDPCSSSADCDVSAPYCVETDEGRCSEACTMDSECPGFGQTAQQDFCVEGGCVECRAGMNDCPANAPICSTVGACVTCELHTDCASGVCAGGACANESQIAYVATNGSASSDCSRTSPCNGVARALAVMPSKQYVLIDVGTYTSTTAIELAGVRTLIGRGTTSRPVLTRSTDGPILATVSNAEVKLEHLEIFGARGAVEPNVGSGIRCSFGASKFELVDTAVRMNQGDGYRSVSCSLVARRSLFEGNGEHGVSLIDSNGDFESCTVVSNGLGMQLDNGVFHVVNTFVVRNPGYGISMYSVGNGNTVQFSTIADNGGLGGFECNLQGGTGTFSNNIFVRNTPEQTTGPCAFPSSISDTNAAPLKFVRPDSAPYDYHLLPGSSAVDLGSSSSVLTDFDGQTRPFGAGPDIGADELH
jgi:hypothetical protein